jgi:hypothetical protein
MGRRARLVTSRSFVRWGCVSISRSRSVISPARRKGIATSRRVAAALKEALQRLEDELNERPEVETSRSRLGVDDWRSGKR